MNIKELYTELLNVNDPWEINGVYFGKKNDIIEIHVSHVTAEASPCPLCGADSPVPEHTTKKRWRHLDTCGTPTYVCAEVPIVRCAEHGKRELLPPWAEPGSDFSRPMMNYIAEMSRRFSMSELCTICGIEHHEAVSLLQKFTGEKNNKSNSQASLGLEALEQTGDRQTSLFDIDTALLNEGLNEFARLNLEKGIELLRRYQSLYPGEKDVDPHIHLMEFLQGELLECPDECPDRPLYLTNLWPRFERCMDEVRFNGHTLIARVKASFFTRVCEAIESCGLGEVAYLSETVPAGFIYIQSGQYDRAVALLQACLRAHPDDASVYGYLGDAYYLRGEPAVARKCYQEALLMDPSAIDWRHLADPEIIELKNSLMANSGMGDELALEWLPSHARIEGLFERRHVPLNNGLKELIDDYLHLNKISAREENPELKARLFYRALILSDNEDSLRFIKKVTLYDVRRLMKEIDGPLFERYLRNIVESGEQRK